MDLGTNPYLKYKFSRVKSFQPIIERSKKKPANRPANPRKAFCSTFRFMGSESPVIRTPKGQNQVSALRRCPYYRGRECMILGISGTKQTVRNREVSVL